MDPKRTKSKRRRVLKSVVFNPDVKQHDGMIQENYMYDQMVSKYLSGKIMFRHSAELVAFYEKYNPTESPNQILTGLKKILCLIDDLIDRIKSSCGNVRLCPQGGGSLCSTNKGKLIYVESLRDFLEGTIQTATKIIEDIGL